MSNPWQVFAFGLGKFQLLILIMVSASGRLPVMVRVEPSWTINHSSSVPIPQEVIVASEQDVGLE